jgi:biopolymer transport protein ExbB/TolQ
MMDLILVALISVAVFFLFVFVYIRENAINKKLKLYEKTFDLINQNIHKLEKELKSRSHHENTTGGDQNLEEFSEVSRLIIDKFQELQKDNLEFKESIIERYLELENKIKPITAVAPSSTGLDENRITTLFSNGFSIEEIAKQLRIGTGEVEFVLKLHDIK